MKVRELMRRTVEGLAPEATLAEAALKMAGSDTGSLPVLSRGKPVGIITDRDIVVRALAEGLKPGETTVASVMSPDVVHCLEDDEIETAAALMTRKGLRRMLVLDAAGALAGVVALGDLGIQSPEEGLSSLIKDELAAAESYRQALQTVRGSGAEELRRIETEHEDAARMLAERMSSLGARPPSGSGLWGAWSRAIEDSERFFDERAVLRILKLGEEQGAANYARMLKNPASDPEVRELIGATLLPRTVAHASALARLLQGRAGS